MPGGNIVVTGLGAVAPNGIGVRAFTSALRAGRSGLSKPDFSHPKVKVPAVGAVRNWQPQGVMPASELRRLPRLVPMALHAAREALAMAGLNSFDESQDDASSLHDRQRTGLILGTGGGGIDFTVAQFGSATSGRNPSLWTITNATHGNLAGELSICLGLRGPSHCVSTGCTSSMDAIGTAMLHLQANRCDVMVVGGADSHLVPEVLWTMQLLGCLCTSAWEPQQSSRPFSRDRDGFVLGEGAWFVVLERAEHARARSAKVLAEMRGYGSTCDAYHRVRPDPHSAESSRAIEQALAQAQMSPRDVEYVQYHGTGTQLNDVGETRTMRRAMSRHADALPGSSIKSMIGHPQGACGAAAVVATIASLAGLDDEPGFLPPTVNLDQPDPECDLDYVAGAARPTRAHNALINCQAFGAKNSALVLRVM